MIFQATLVFADSSMVLQSMDFVALTNGPQAQLHPLDTQSPSFSPSNSWDVFSSQVQNLSNQYTIIGSTDSAIKMLTELGEWQALATLSDLADRLWQKLVECSNGDTEKARLNYFSGQLCQENRKNQELHSEIVLLHKNVLNLLRSGQFYIPKPSKRPVIPSRNQFVLDYRDHSITDINVNLWTAVNQLKKPQFHPLLTQIIFEYFAIITRVTKVSYLSPYSDYSTKKREIGIEEILSDYIDPAFSTMMTSVRTSEVAYWNELNENGLLDKPETYETAKIFINIWLLVSLVTKDSCNTIGLWPEMSFALLLNLTDQNQKVSHEIARVASQLTCPNRPELKKEWAMAPYNVNDADILKLFRRMGQQYGFKLYDKSECIFSLSGFLMPGLLRRAQKCFTIDPSAPEDIDLGKAWARDEYHPDLVRFKKALEFIKQQ